MARHLEVWLLGVRIGTLAQVDRRLSFSYAADWLARNVASLDQTPLSQSLPPRAEPFDERATRPFFAGLLPEGAVIQVLDAAQPPERKSKPRKAQIALMTTLAVGFALLLFIFIRQGLRGAAQTPESAEKLSRLRHAWNKALGRNKP